MKKSMRRLLAVAALAVFLGPVGWHLAGAQDRGKGSGRDTKAGAVFEVYKDRGGAYRFRLRDAEGNLLAIASKGHKTKADCEKVIQAIQREAARATIDDKSK